MSFKSIVVACGIAVSISSVPGHAFAQGSDSRADITHLLARTTFGVRPVDISRAEAMGPTKWLDEQLHPDRINDSAITRKLQPLETLHLSISELAEKYALPKKEARQEKKRAGEMSMQDTMQMGEPAEMRAGERANGRKGAKRPDAQAPKSQALQGLNQRVILAQLVSAKLIRAAESNRQLEEVMTDFWFNHFNVFWGSGPVRYMVADYEENAIRPHVFGKFEDLLRATAQHPAMLLYLNNAMSAAPDTNRPFMRAVVRKAKRPIGLNENYARELMELHTLGVDGGYTQMDVTEVARAFTGWTITRPLYGAQNPNVRANQGGFQFVAQLHDRGEKMILGKKFPANRGIDDGEEVLHMLARSPATAHFIARKLVERFVSDDAPADFVNELANVFLETDGDLRAVTRALFTSPKFYDAKYRRVKVKTPFELVASALRTTNADVRMSRPLVETLRTLGELPYMEQAPTGFPAASADWVNSGAMLARMNFAIALANGDVGGARGLRADAQRVCDQTPGRPCDTDAILAAVLPGADTGKRRAQVMKDAPNDVQRALGYALGSPEFQLK